MTRRLRHLMPLLAVTAAAGIAGGPPAHAQPQSPGGGQSAGSVIDELRDQGYNVQINWVTGFDTKPLSDCWVTGVNNPGGQVPTEGAFVTVYVDVACPNGDDSGFQFGVGLG